MSRDMSTNFGRGWAARRGSGGRGVAGGKFTAHNAPGLVMPCNAQYFLEPNRKPTALSSLSEQKVLVVLDQFEQKFGAGIITPVFISSVARIEVLSQLPELEDGSNIAELWESNGVQGKLNVMIRQLLSVSRESWLRSFMNRHKNLLRRVERRRALEKHKASKHQFELVLSHFRNVYQVEALSQIQRHMARTGEGIPGFVRFHNIVQCHTDSGSESLLEVREGLVYVKALGKPLEHISAKFRFALDETPIVPYSTMLKAIAMNRKVPLSCGRASIWTLLPFYG